MGCRSCVEKVFKVDMGERSFRSGVARPLLIPFIIFFIALFLFVVGILLCILHATYIAARHDQLYSEDNLFLVFGVVCICVSLLLMAVAGGWWYFVRYKKAEEIEDYKIRKGYSMENVNRYAPSVASGGSMRSSRGSFRSQRGFSDNSYPPEYADTHDPRYAQPHAHAHNMRAASTASSQYPAYVDPDEVAHIARSSQRDPLTTRASRNASKNLDDFKSFVKRNVEASRSDSPSKRKTPFSDRLPPPAHIPGTF